MIDTGILLDAFQKNGIRFFTGVPDSLLGHFCAYLSDHVPERSHVIAANEGGAVALAAGHYLATGRLALIYMQNSGLGNAVNPLVSLADPAIYGIPMLLLIGWRGEPGVHDEPQHVKQGAITPALCETMGIPHRTLPADTAPAIECLGEIIRLAIETRGPVALIVRANTFEKYSKSFAQVSPYLLKREAAIARIVSLLPADSAVVATTGHISRELFEFRERTGRGHQRDFLTVGSMGHASQIALGMALANPGRPTVCLDGDGAVLMHMGAMAILGASGARNVLHVVLNNGAHDSVGGQPTVGFNVDLVRVAEACGYPSSLRLEGEDEIQPAMHNLVWTEGPHFLEVRVAKGARKDLGRPTTRPEDNKKSFMDFIASNETTGS